MKTSLSQIHTKSGDYSTSSELTMVGAKSLSVVCVAMATVLMIAVWRHQEQSMINFQTTGSCRRVKRPSLDDLPLSTDDLPFSTDDLPLSTDDLPLSTDDLPLSTRVMVNVTAPIAIVDERFLSVGCTLGSINRTLGKIYNSTRFHTVARGLAPAIFRLGGAEADFTDFKSDDSDEHSYGKLSFFNMTIHGKVWDNLHEFTRSVGWEILFNLNALHRTASGEWDPTNAIELLSYNKKKGHRTLWALGNEPNGYPRKAHVNITGDEMGRSFHKLRDVMIRDIGEEGAFVSGPDVSAPMKLKRHAGLTSTDKYLDDFLNVAGNTTNVTSFHFYYISGRSASYFNFTNPDLADNLIRNIASIKSSVDKYRSHRRQVWISESGVTFASGTTGISQNFAVGFLLLDKLGIAARYGASLVVQQGLVGKTGGILDQTFSPRLPYWMLLYHKRLMGTHVLDVSKVVSAKSRVSDPLDGSSVNFTKYVRIYAHCTKASWMYSPGSVTLMIINMVPIDAVPVSLEGALRKSRIDEYLFTPLGTQGLFSPKAKLSGQRLTLTGDLTLPYHKPRRFPADTVIHVPSMTYGFYVFPDAAAPACMSSS